MIFPVSKFKPWLRVGIGEPDTEIALEDASLHLSTIGLSLSDLLNALQAAGYTIDDNLATVLEAFLQALDDAGISLETWATGREDLKAFLAAFFLDLEEDLAMELSSVASSFADFASYLATWATGFVNLPIAALAYGEDRGNLASDLNAVGYQYQNLASYFAAASSTVLVALATYLAATDGSALSNLALRLSVRKQAPSFQAVVAQRLASVMMEV